MPTQFDYPEEGWSTGSMRKSGGLPQISPEEWQDWNKNTVWGFKADPTVGVYAQPEHDLKQYVKDRPDGFVTDKRHKGLKDIENMADVYSIPHSGFEDAVFVKAKVGPSAKMLPTSGSATQVLGQAAGRQKGKRKEAEAM
jgi:hypothetical protein